MKLTRSKLLLAAGAALAAVSVRKTIQRSSLRVVPSIDLPRYMGRWYEIAHLPAWFQRDCDGDTSATYTLLPNGRIEVLNACRTPGGELKTARGIARVACPRGPNSKLKVRFAWPFSGDYWVIDLDPEYQWAAVGEPSRNYLWILSRQPHMEPEVLDAILQGARQQGYATHRLIRTPHTASASVEHTI